MPRTGCSPATGLAQSCAFWPLRTLNCWLGFSAWSACCEGWCQGLFLIGQHMICRWQQWGRPSQARRPQRSLPAQRSPLRDIRSSWHDWHRQWWQVRRTNKLQGGRMRALPAGEPGRLLKIKLPGERQLRVAASRGELAQLQPHCHLRLLAKRQDHTRRREKFARRINDTR